MSTPSGTSRVERRRADPTTRRPDIATGFTGAAATDFQATAVAIGSAQRTSAEVDVDA